MTEVFYIARVHGLYQWWADGRGAVRALGPPEPFTGYISSNDWGFQASKERSYAFRFFAPVAISPAHIGPWWYTINRVEWIKVTRTVTETEEILP